MKNKLPLKATVRKQTHDVLLESGCEARIMPLAGISDAKISDVLGELGYEDENKQKPLIVSAKHDEKDRLLIKTVNPEREVLIEQPWKVADIENGLNEIGASADDYESFCQTLEKHGLPRPSNQGLISGSEREELTLPNLNQFGHPIKKPEIDPTLFVDEELSISDLFEFEIDINAPLFHIDSETRRSIQELFEFDQPKTKKKQK